jgi:hypothetical protein
MIADPKAGYQPIDDAAARLPLSAFSSVNGEVRRGP